MALLFVSLQLIRQIIDEPWFQAARERASS